MNRKELRALLKEYNASEHPYDSDLFTISIQDIEALLVDLRNGQNDPSAKLVTALIFRG